MILTLAHRVLRSATLQLTPCCIRGYKVLRSRNMSPSSLVNYMYKNCAGGIYVRARSGCSNSARCCDLRFIEVNTIFILSSFFFVQSETNTRNPCGMALEVAIFVHGLQSSDFRSYSLVRAILLVFTTQSLLRKRFETRSDVIIKVLSQTLVPPTPRMVHTLIWGGHLEQAFIFGKFSNHSLASFQAISSFEQPCGLTQVNTFSLLCPPEDLIPPPVMPQNLQVHLQLT